MITTITFRDEDGTTATVTVNIDRATEEMIVKTDFDVPTESPMRQGHGLALLFVRQLTTN